MWVEILAGTNLEHLHPTQLPKNDVHNWAALIAAAQMVADQEKVSTER